MKEGRIIKRSVSVAGHPTSVSLEEAFWIALRACAAQRRMPVQALIGEIDSTREGQNLSSAIRVFVLRDLQQGSAEAPRPIRVHPGAIGPTEAA